MYVHTHNLLFASPSTTLNLGHMPPISEVSDQVKLSDTHHYADGAARSAAQ